MYQPDLTYGNTICFYKKLEASVFTIFKKYI